jgi:alkanesulfonate monooxygenase SsuD/methylene tetrahydromethanopterin reductase-like flavin-dependent oxidoreductase (luciferase family)
MRVGIYLDLRNPPEWRRSPAEFYAQALETVEEAERLGADSVWLSEHHFFEDGYLPQPLTFAAAVAARTTRIRIGTAVLLAPLRPAVQIAEEAAIVDLVSGGRLDLGLGAGYRVPEFAAYGADLSRRYGLVEERVREIREFFSSGGVTPAPVQDPFPIWLGFGGPQGARRAGRLGEGLLTLSPQLVEPYREGLIEGGHDPESGRMAGPLMFVLADDPESAWQQIRPHFQYQWDSYRRYLAEGRDMPTPPPVDPERWRRPDRSGGPPRLGVLGVDEAVEMLRGWLPRMPAREIFFWSSIAGMPDELARRHVELVCTDLRDALTEL